MENTLPALLSSLTDSLEVAATALPEESNALPPRDGISLLDVKNEIFLSYLQNLAFLIILKARSLHGSGHKDDDEEDDSTPNIRNEVVKKLVELRVYLEKGVRPLEGRLKYQIDKVLRAADDSARTAPRKLNGISKRQAKRAPKSGNGSETSQDDDDHRSNNNRSDAASSASSAEIDELAYRPNPAAFLQSAPTATTKPSSAAAPSRDAIYRPPRITPTALPTTTTAPSDRREPRKPMRSATLDEYVNTELSTAPSFEPSIGSTIVAAGRRNTSERERRDEAERNTYEEANFVRLPKESRAERKKKGARGPRDGGYGGEEWRGLGEGVERIERLTKGVSGSGRGGALDRSRKRARAVEDGPRGDGVGIGEVFEKRRRKVIGRGRGRGRK